MKKIYIPRIKAEPHKHAHWISDKHGTYKCSNCGYLLGAQRASAIRGDTKSLTHLEYLIYLTFFCPNCDAEMDFISTKEEEQRP